jgi:hypothetical protein
MMRKIKYLAGAAAAAAMLAASPAAAQYGGYYPDPRYDPRYDDRGDGFDVATGIAVVGTIANILNAFRGGRYGYSQPYGYSRPYGYSQPYGYGQSYGYGNYGGYNYDYAYAVNNAVNSCGREAQRFSGGGRVEIRDVDQVSGGRMRVRGVFDDLRNSRYGRLDRDGFSCLAYRNGAIQDFDVN